jgi:hypothetical protein
MNYRISIYMLCAAMALLGFRGVSVAQQALDRVEAAGVVEIENLRIDKDRISAEIVNKSPHPVRDIAVLISHAWRWQNEFRPGTDSPGTAVYHKLDYEIAPGERAAFTHIFAEPLPEERRGGEFETIVSVAEYTSVIPQ